MRVDRDGRDTGPNAVRRDQSDARHDRQTGSLPRATCARWDDDRRRQCRRLGDRAQRGIKLTAACNGNRHMRSGGVSDPPGSGGRALAALGRGVAHAPAALSRSVADDDSGFGRQTPPPVIVACKSRGHQRIDGPLLSPDSRRSRNSASRVDLTEGGTLRRTSVPLCVLPPQPVRWRPRDSGRLDAERLTAS